MAYRIEENNTDVAESVMATTVSTGPWLSGDSAAMGLYVPDMTMERRRDRTKP
jgi:hypothetical protein